MDKATVALILSVVSIAISATIGILDYRIQRARRLEEVESQKRADLHARLAPPGRPNHLVLSVSGGTSARDVVIELEPETVILSGEPTSFKLLDPGQEANVWIAITRGDFPPQVPRVLLVRLSWRDDRGSHAKSLNLTV